MKNKEKWHSHGGRLEYTRFKLIAGTLLTVIVMGCIGYIAYGSFQRILFSLDHLGNPRQETHLVQELVIHISELENKASTYAITRKNSDLEGYVQNRAQVNQLIDSLKNSIGKRDYYKKVDSLDFFFKQYIHSLDEWLLVVRSSNPQQAMGQVYETLEKGDSSLVEDANNIPRSEITTITTTVEKPVLVSKGEKQTKEESKNKKSIL